MFDQENSIWFYNFFILLKASNPFSVLTKVSWNEIYFQIIGADMRQSLVNETTFKFSLYNTLGLTRTNFSITMSVTGFFKNIKWQCWCLAKLTLICISVLSVIDTAQSTWKCFWKALDCKSYSFNGLFRNRHQKTALCLGDLLICHILVLCLKLQQQI